MANYTTNSGFDDLDGSMSVTNNNVDSYNSTTLGTGNVRNLGGSGLNFNVSFGATPAHTYHVNASANANGHGFGGSANNNGPGAGQQPWAATATEGEEAAATKTAY